MEKEYKDIVFKEKEEIIELFFLKIFRTFILKKDLESISPFKVSKHMITFEKYNEKRFNRLLSDSFNHLVNNITNNPTLYIHKNSGIPLIGSLSFGIVDKGSNMIEIKPITSCNINCTFCSVSEGPGNDKILDIVIEKDYLVEETLKILEYKAKTMDIYINPHGEPLLYADIIELVRDLKKHRLTRSISIITNATLLDKEILDNLIKAGLDSLNISINSIDKDKSNLLAGNKQYNVIKILKIIKDYKKKIKIILAPVFIPKVNQEDIEDLIKFAKKEGLTILIQNFMFNKRGRKPAKPITLDKFFNILTELEKKYDLKLIPKYIKEYSKELPKPYKTGETIEVELIKEGRYPGEYLAKSKERIVTIKGMPRKSTSKVKITRDIHNIFYDI